MQVILLLADYHLTGLQKFMYTLCSYIATHVRRKVLMPLTAQHAPSQFHIGGRGQQQKGLEVGGGAVGRGAWGGGFGAAREVLGKGRGWGRPKRNLVNSIDDTRKFSLLGTQRIWQGISAVWVAWRHQNISRCKYVYLYIYIYIYKYNHYIITNTYYIYPIGTRGMQVY